MQGRGLAMFGIVAFAVITLQSDALTIHRSFRSRNVGFGGGVGASVPVDSRVAKALEEGLAQEANRTKVVIGRVTSVIDGRTLRLVTGGGTLVLVRLEGVEVAVDNPELIRKQAAALKKLVQGRNVRVEFRSKDDDGLIVGQVTCGKQNVNQTDSAVAGEH